MKKKILSLILSAAMVATATIVPVSAADVKDFADVAANSWYYDSVKFVAERDYMNGTSATTFSPDNNMTRAMFVTVMARVAGAQTDNSATTEFTDVPSGQWYTGAVQWGVEKGLVQGHGDGTFGTNDPITRQDTAVLAERFLKWYSEATGLTPETGSKVDSFTDASSISDYAKDSVEYCRQIGLLTGYEDGSFKPLKSITRAEAATILKRMTFLAEGVLTVTYTDENGKTVMMEVKEGDTFTVDPNGGKITYDGKTYDAEFTITVGTASLTLPAPTRSGYTFKGWKVTEAADGTPAFTAQWASSGGGGGGGNQPSVTEITHKYTIGFNIKKDEKSIDKIISYNYQGEEDSYEVTFLNDIVVENESDNIDLVTIAKGFCDHRNIDAIKNPLLPMTIGSETVIDKDGFIHDVTVEKVPVTDVVDSKDIAEIFNQSGSVGQKVTSADVEVILNILDSGVKDKEDFINLIENNDQITIEPNTAVSVVETISKKLAEKIDGEHFSDEIKESLDDKLGAGTAESLLGKLGISDSDLLGMAQSYLNKLNGIFNISTSGISLLAVEDATTGGGIEVKVNPVDVLSESYGTATNKYKGAWNIINKILDDAQLTLDDKNMIKEVIRENKIIEKCDPLEFFAKNDGNGLYKLKKSMDYQSQLVDIIDKLETARVELFVTGVNGNKISSSQVSSMIKSYADRMSEFVGDEYAEKFEKIKNKSDELAEVFVMKNPTLLDLMECTSGGIYENFSIEETFNLDVDKANSIIKKLLEKIDLGIEDINNNEFVDNLTNALKGKYTAKVYIDVQ